MEPYLEQTLRQITAFKGATPWMYLDQSGIVSVGVALALPEVTAAKRLPFQVGTRAATEDDIEAAFARVAGLPPGRPALFYHQPGGPELEPFVIDALLRTALVGTKEQLRQMLPGYQALPPGRKMALLDMAHDLTPAGILTQYPELIQAIKAGSWPRAAALSFRPGAGTLQNQGTIAMLQTVTSPRNIANHDAPWKRFGYGMVGVCATLASHLKNKQK